MDINDLNNTGQTTPTYVAKPFLPTVLKYGGIGAVVMIVINTISYLFLSGVTDSMSALATILLTPITILIYAVIMYLSTSKYRESCGGFVTLGKAFLNSFLTGLLMALVSLVFTIIWYYFIGMPGQEGMDTLNSITENSSTRFLIILGATLFSFLMGCGVGAIVALIVSAILKKNPPISWNRTIS